MAEERLMQVHFHDEGMPQIGAGWRLVKVTIGRKWAHVQEVHGGAGKKKFNLPFWGQISRTGREVNA